MLLVVHARCFRIRHSPRPCPLQHAIQLDHLHSLVPDAKPDTQEHDRFQPLKVKIHLFTLHRVIHLNLGLNC